jgi:hypothetical protein
VDGRRQVIGCEGRATDAYIASERRWTWWAWFVVLGGRLHVRVWAYSPLSALSRTTHYALRTTHYVLRTHHHGHFTREAHGPWFELFDRLLGHPRFCVGEPLNVSRRLVPSASSQERIKGFTCGGTNQGFVFAEERSKSGACGGSRWAGTARAIST